MKRNLFDRCMCVIVIASGICVLPVTAAVEWSGSLTAEGRFFFHKPRQEGQVRHGGGTTLTLGGHYTSDNAFQAAAEAHLEVDGDRESIPHSDLREFFVTYMDPAWRLLVGFHRVTWGASDVLSVVDVINQQDGLAWPGLTHKFGQPMVAVSIWPVRGRLDFYYMPLFREFPFPARRGRLRPPRPVAVEHALYESGSASRTHDVAIRYGRSVGRADLAVHVFEGRNRTPYLVPDERLPDVIRPDGIERGTVLVPVYEDMVQVGGDLFWAVGAWLWKAEVAWREGLADTYMVGIGGFERSCYGWGVGMADLSLIVEYGFDTRGRRETSNALLDRHVFIGGRWGQGDVAGTSARGGLLVDVRNGETLGAIQAERRIGDRSRLGIDVLWLEGIKSSSRLDPIRRDDLIRLQWTRYF